MLFNVELFSIPIIGSIVPFPHSSPLPFPLKVRGLFYVIVPRYGIVGLKKNFR